MEDIDDMIMNVIRSGPCNVSSLCRQIQARKHDVIQGYKRLERYGLLTARKERGQVLLMSQEQDLRRIFPNFDNFIQIHLEKINPHLKELKKVKNLGKQLVRKRYGSLYRVDSKAARELDNVIYILNFIGNRYALPYSYADHLHILPKKYTNTLHQNLHMCAQVTNKVVKQLFNDHKSSEQELRTYLSWNLHSYLIFDKNFV